MSEEPTTPAPLPEGKGETELGAPLGASEARGSSSPFPSGRGAGVVGLIAAVAALALVAFAVWYFAVRTPEPRDDLGRFQGEWRLTVEVRFSF